MINKKELYIPLFVAALLVLIPLWFLLNYTGPFLHNYKLSNRGIESTATVINKGVLNGDELLKPRSTIPSDHHFIYVSYNSGGRYDKKCKLGVSKSTYDALEKHDQLQVVYLKESPENCTLPYSIDLNFKLGLVLLGISALFLLLAAGFINYIWRSFRKTSPGSEVKPTSDLGLEGKIPSCPRCGNPMTEGYLPTVGGVTWRDRTDPIGIPSMFTGLPGTTHKIKRPALHAFHCKPCQIITFAYGDNKN